MSPIEVLLVAVAAVLTSTLTAMVGFGGGVVLLALLLVFVEPTVAIPLQAAIQVVSNGTRAAIRRDDIEWRITWPAAALMLPAGALAIPLVVRTPEAALQAIIAVAVLVATWVPERTSLDVPALSTRGWLGFGAVTGALNVVVGATGPLQAPFLRAATSDRLGFVGTFATVQVAGHLCKIVLFGIAGFAIGDYWGAAIAGIAGVVVGTNLGSRVLDRMPEAVFRRVYLVAITLVGIYLLDDAALG
jgi:uncharacterized membrane protein YfcA